MNTSVRRALFIVQLETQFRELLRVAKLLRDTGRYVVRFCFDEPQPATLERMRRVASQENFNYFLFDERPPVPASTSKPEEQAVANSYLRAGPSSVIKSLIPYWLLVSLRYLRYATGYYPRQLARAENLIVEERPDVVVIAEDGMGGNRAIIKQAHAHDIPVVIIPYEYSTITQPVEAIKEVPRYREIYGMKNPLNKLVARCFPAWRQEYGGEKFLREPGVSILLQKWFDIDPPLPWAVHGGRADRLAVESGVMFIHYRKQGIASEKLVVTGALTNDVLAETLHQRDERKAELLAALELPERERLILCALPPDHLSMRPNCDFKSYEELLDFWVDALLRLENVNVVFQLHPRITEEQAHYIKSKGAKITQQDIAILIPLCDLLITSVSSIIRIAIACRIPVINYDVYRFGYSDYDEAGGVITMKEQEEFLTLLRKVMTQDSFYNELLERQTACANDWGQMDGQVAPRLLELFDSLIIEPRQKGIET